MSQHGDSPLVLLVLPGAEGRRPILDRLLAVSRICVLVPSDHLKRSAWARAVVGNDNWIGFEAPAAASGEATPGAEAAGEAVRAWAAAAPNRSIGGIMTYDDFGVELTAAVAETLQMSCTPVAQIRALRHKFLFRERCRLAGLPAARSVRLAAGPTFDASAIAGLRFPCVLKPVKGAGSWYVTKIEDEQELARAFAQASEDLLRGACPAEIIEAGFVLEEYFEGHEVDVDGWARNGVVEFCLVSDNRPALEPHFLELGGIYPSQLPESIVASLEQLTRDVVAAFPGIHGCFHFEAKVNAQTLEVMPIEFNSRCGGAECPASVEATTGYYLPEVAARLALDLPVVSRACRHAVVASTNIHVPQAGVLKECSDQGADRDASKVVTSVLCGQVGQTHVPNNGSISCLGFLATGGETVEEAERNLQAFLEQLRIVVAPEVSDGGGTHGGS